MSIYAPPGTTFEATFNIGTTGLTTVGVRIVDGQGATTTARTTVGVVESPAGSGIYTATMTAPTTGGTYQVIADIANAAPFQFLTLEVTSSSAAVVTPGAGYFTVAEARAAAFLGGALTSSATYPDADIDAMRDAVESALELECGVAFVQRTATDECHDGNGDTDLFMDWARPTLVTAASIGGTAISVSDIATLVYYKDGRIYYSAGWTAGRGNVLISYTHGFAACPGRVKRAAMLLTRRFLVDSPVNDRATSLVNSDGSQQFMVTAAVRGAIFDVPEANAVLAEYNARADVH